MKASPTIPKNPALPSSMDFEQLRQLGLQQIERLSSAYWTDYNSHDPGITILEALCYAITELGYRAKFEIKDLLADASGQTFFTARQILTSAPWTIADYRKLLVDIKGINNAWLLPKGKQEVPVFIHCEEDQLQYEITDQPLMLKGLYTVLLDLEIDLESGDLNTGDIEMENIAFPSSPMVDIEAGEFQVKFELPSVKEIAPKVLKEEVSSIAIVKNAEKNWHYSFKVEWADGDTAAIPFRVSIAKHPKKGKVQDSHVWLMLQDSTYAEAIWQGYLEKILKAHTIIQKAIKTLHENRNICEDFVKVEPISSEEIAFCFDVDARPEADIERIQAEIYFAIQNYLNPSIRFYTLRELTEQGVPSEEIFEGPALGHGFIKSDEIEQSQLRSVIYASDIISLLMDIEGVLGVRNFLMTKYDKEGKPVAGEKGISWCMSVAPLHKPVMSESFSKILFFKDGFPFLSRYEEVKDTVQLLHAQNTIGKLVATFEDLPVPKGRRRDTLSHWPVQYDLPMVYGVGEFGLPTNADSLRKAQQQQLKGYLMFFEQLLADFFAQLTNAKTLFSTDLIRQTYFAQYLGSIKETEEILHLDLEKAIANDPLDTTSQELWRRLYENQPAFFERRNRFLDHLLARFGESFNDFALLMYRINLENISLEKVEPQELLDIKINTLETYAEVSHARNLAFNYFPQTEAFELDEGRLWDTDNVSGLEKRISCLTGIRDFTRRFLYCIKNVEIICEEKEVGEEIHCQHHFSMVSRTGTILVSKQYPSKSEAESVLAEVLELGINKDNFHYTNKKIKLKKGNTILLTSEQNFQTEELALAEINAIAEELTAPCPDPEGLHLLEHILLRPKSKNFDLLEVCLQDCDCPCEWDPYSFRASVVLPHWPKHFDNMAFRKYFEDKIREQAPAHIQLKICWVSNEQLREFEVRYQKWILELGRFSAGADNQPTYQEANDKMVEILSMLHSVYPKATLHDCEESDADKNPVMLGKTILGTQKL